LALTPIKVQVFCLETELYRANFGFSFYEQISNLFLKRRVSFVLFWFFL